MGLANWFSGRRIAALLVVLLSLAASLKPVLRLVLPADCLERAFSQNPWPQSWIFQASWAPQHLASASCVVVAVLILSRIASARNWLMVPLLAVTVAAGFESSAWVGGVVFAAAGAPIGTALLMIADDSRARLDLLTKAAAAAVLASAISFPFLLDMYLATAARRAGAPLAFRPFDVLGPIVPQDLRPALDLPAYWVILLAVQFPAIYFAGMRAMAGAVAARGTPLAQQRCSIGLVLLAGASFIVSWLFTSTIANNDLGARGVLPGILVLTIFAAAGLARWLATVRALALAAVAFWALGVPGGLRIIKDNAVGFPTPSAAASQRRRNCGLRYAGMQHRTSASPTTPHSLPMKCAGQSTFPGHCWPIAAPVLPGGTWRGRSCRCRRPRSTTLPGCSNESSPASARPTTPTSSPPASTAAWW